ncbi:MAG: hypothetical protein BMS9Abin08_0332 [Gammaproteobacteria bacterium]|nr:MAG: hypothetical protein BMS9Abin08_0332 [Gammaproteobacteria bacterium]
MSNATKNAHFTRLSNGRLADIREWNEDAAQYLAQTQGIELTDKHWEIIHLMRDFYAEFNISPIQKLLIKNIKEKLGNDKATDDWLNQLFPDGVLTQGTLIAGLPIPLLDAEIDRPVHPPRSAEARTTPQSVRHFVDQFELNSQTFRLSFHGNLLDSSQWSEEVAEFMAKKEGVALTDEHWEVIRFLRQFYFKYGITPMVKLLKKHMAKQLGKEKSSEAHLYNLFPDGPSRQGSRIAGLPEPQGCIN